jgi:flagellar hook-associated protein 1 FlgK
MSLTSALLLSSAGLRQNERQISTISSNIANADTVGYTQKTYVSGTATTNSGTIPIDGGVQARVNSYLSKSANKEASSAGKDAKIAEYLEYYDGYLGSTDGDNLGGSLADLISAIEALAATPEDTAMTTDVVAGADALSYELRALSDNIQDLRAQADQEIATVVNEINQCLEDIDALNEKISIAKANNENYLDLEDQRNVALRALSERIGIQYFTNDQGMVTVYSSSGELMVGSSAHTLSYEPATAVSGDTVYPGGFQGIMLNGKDVTEEIRGGSLDGLIELRDETLVAEQEKLDAYARVLMDTANAAHNQGTASPAPNALTGAFGFAVTDALAAIGSWRIATVDASGTVQSVADLDLSTFATVGDLVTAMDGLAGVSASLDAEGRLVITADNPDHGIALNEMDSSVGADAKGAGHFFGMNNMFSSESTGAENIRVRADINADASRFATSILSDDGALAVGDSGVAAGNGSNLQALVDALEGDQAFDAAGNFSAKTTTLSAYASAIVADAATQISDATNRAETSQTTYEYLSDKLSNETGVNIDQETANLAAIESLYEANALMISKIQEMFDALLSAVQ